MKLIESFNSPNFNSRQGDKKVIFLILHYTAMQSCEEAIAHMCNKNNKVSSHFLISRNGHIYQLVDLDKRAWHAGESYWKGITDINSYSIGIELDNSGHHIKNENFNNLQINSLCILLEKLVKKYNIMPNNILGHSDISPFRKIDPGEKFPWIKLDNRKLCYLPKVEKFVESIKRKNQPELALGLFRKIGYDTRNLNSKDNKFKLLIKAYQRHFRQQNISGILDSETFALIEKHCKDLLT